MGRRAAAEGGGVKRRTSDRCGSEHLDHRHHRGVQDRHVAGRVAAAHPRPVTVPRRLPGERRHRRVDRPCPRARLSRRVGNPHPPQPLSGGGRAHLPPPVRSRLQSRRLSTGRWRSAGSSAMSAIEALAEGWAFAPIEAPRKERIAVVGGGPSGLSAAFHLRRRGYAVTLFESRPELGGLMRYGIPSYRLARSVLDGEIARIVALGIDVRCGESMETSEDFERLRSRVRRRVPRHRRPVPEAPAATRLHPALGDGRCRLPGAGERRRPAGPRQACGRDRRRKRRDRRRAQRAARRARGDDPGARKRGADAGAARGSRRSAGGRHCAGRRRNADRGRRHRQRRPRAQVRARAVRGGCAARAIHGDAGRRQRILARGGCHRPLDRAGPRPRAARSRARSRWRAAQGRPAAGDEPRARVRRRRRRRAWRAS